MPQADFYVLPAADPAARQRFLCRLAEKIVPAGHQLHIHCDSKQQAVELDRLLWEFKAESFIPHCLVDSENDAPVQLGWQDEQIDPERVFVNMTEQLPDRVLKIERVVEIVVQTPEILSATRNHYKRYQEHNYHINMNDMRPKRR